MSNTRSPRLSSATPFLLLALLISASANSSGSPADEVARARALFRAPPRDYSTGPLWVWNDMLTKDQVRDTLRDLARQNVRQVWVHPRPGLMTPYLSEEWFELWKLALKEGKRLDMNVWIYDENSYPSGFAGGFVPEAMPESRGQGVDLREVKGVPEWSADTLAVYREADGKWQEVSREVQSAHQGTYLVATRTQAPVSPWHGGRFYVNLLTPGVTEKFLDVTLEPYKAAVGKEFGRRIPGVFTDEPHIRPARGLPWCEDLPEQFKKRWGYSLVENLPSLVRETGDWRKVRHDYLSTLNDLFIERWAIPFYDRCEELKLESTGHYWEHEWPNCIRSPDNMAMAGYQHRPGVDCLMNQYAEHNQAQFGNVRYCREVSSVANQLGRERTLVEAYGAGGWDLRFEDMKRIGDWLQVLGVNTINEHLSYVTIRGARKRDHPQSFSYHTPWWEDYQVMANHFTRVSAALTQGQQVNRVLVIEPTRTAWMYQGNAASLKTLGDAFYKLLTELEAAQVEYDLGCEEIINRKGSIRDGELVVGQRSYRSVILPPFNENLSKRTHELLGQVRDRVTGVWPGRIDGAELAGSAYAAQTAATHGDVTKWIAKVVEREVAAQREHEGFAIEREAGDKGILFHHRRLLSKGKEQVLFLVNTSITDPARGRVVCRGRGAEVWDTQTGEMRPWPVEARGGLLTMSFDLPPCGSLLLFVGDLRPAVQPEAEVVKELTAKGSVECAREDLNVLTLDYVDVKAGGDERKNTYVYQANQFVWRQNGMARNPWDSAVQFKDELIRKEFPPTSGFEAAYRFEIQAQVPADLEIVVERPDLYTITCNGKPVTPMAGKWWLDKAFGRIPLTAVAKPGENVVSLKAAPFTIFHELESAYVRGSFSLKPLDRGFAIVAATPLRVASDQGWNFQGSPFYSSGVVYRQNFDVQRKQGQYVVALPAWHGSVARLKVNGNAAGVIASAPWTCDVTKLIRPGGNRVEATVVGTLRNLLGPHHGNAALGSAWPRHFQTGPENGPPAGAQYKTVGYGMFAPFELRNHLRGETQVDRGGRRSSGD